MASSEVDEKFLGRFAKLINDDNPYLSSMLFKILGLSVILSKKLRRARRLRKLDTTRDTKSLKLYHHIIWLSREGLVIVEQYIIPMVANHHRELKVLSYKLRASFYHIFVLFHNDPPATQAAIPSLYRTHNAEDVEGHGNKRSPREPSRSSPTQQIMNGGPVGGLRPPGLGGVPTPKPTSTFLLPAQNYIPIATACFDEAAQMADELLSGSHPIRLSVKLEYTAFLYDCLRDAEASRRLAKQTVAEVYRAQEGMDDDMFEDAAELVGLLGKMMKRGMAGTPGSTPGGATSSSPGSRATPKSNTKLPPAVPPPRMANPI